MDKNELDAIRAREEKATLGPWHFDDFDPGVWQPDFDMRIADMRGWGHLTGQGHGGLGLSEDDAIAAQIRNAEFIAYARQDIPALLDALEEAEARNTPLAVVKQRTLVGDCTCPRCKAAFIGSPLTVVAERTNCCGNCGQRLGWEGKIDGE